jgi:isopenicillin-N N-acyltransferase like protein
MKQPTIHKARFPGVGLFLLLFVSQGQATEPPPAPEKPKGKLKVVVLEGPPYNRGLVYGKTLKDDIQQLMKRWKENLRATYKMDPDAFIKKFYAKTDYVSAMKRWTPELLEEVRGLADGVGVDQETMLVFQFVDEYWVNGENIAAEKCSAIGVGRRGDHPAMVAQNLDIEGFNDGSQVVLHIRHQDSELESFVFASAGMVGANGMNNRGIGICANTLAQLRHGRDGLPVACIIRGVLEQKTFEAAADFLQQIKHASGQNYLIGGPDKVASFECSHGKVSRFGPAEGSDIVWHTNHPLANDDYDAKYRQYLEKNKDAAKKPSSTIARFDCLASRLGRNGSAIDKDGIKAILRSHDSPEFPVCRPLKTPSGVYTFGSMIMVLSGKPEFHVAPGPPDAVPYQVLSFDKPTLK